MSEVENGSEGKKWPEDSFRLKNEWGEWCKKVSIKIIFMKNCEREYEAGTKVSLQANEKKKLLHGGLSPYKIKEEKKVFCFPFMQTNDYFENYSTWNVNYLKFE